MVKYKTIKVSGTLAFSDEFTNKIGKAINEEAVNGWELCDFELQGGCWFFVGWGKYAIIVMSRQRQE